MQSKHKSNIVIQNQTRKQAEKTHKQKKIVKQKANKRTDIHLLINPQTLELLGKQWFEQETARNKHKQTQTKQTQKDKRRTTPRPIQQTHILEQKQTKNDTTKKTKNNKSTPTQTKQTRRKQPPPPQKNRTKKITNPLKQKAGTTPKTIQQQNKKSKKTKTKPKQKENKNKKHKNT